MSCCELNTIMSLVTPSLVKEGNVFIEDSKKFVELSLWYDMYQVHLIAERRQMKPMDHVQSRIANLDVGHIGNSYRTILTEHVSKGMSFNHYIIIRPNIALRLAGISKVYGSCAILFFPSVPFSKAACIILFPLIIDVVQMMICFRAGTYVLACNTGM